MSKLAIVNEIHKQARLKFARRRVIQRGLHDTWQIDLVDMIKYSRFNKGYHYLLTIIDIFSKYAYGIPLKSKSAKDVTNAMKNILKKAKKVPKNIHSDEGKEFFNQSFSTLMKKHDINHYHTYSKMKASIVERFNRTLKSKMWKKFNLNGNYQWVSILDNLINDYNNVKHRTIGMKPKDVTEKTVKKLLKTVYNHPKIIRKIKFKVNDYVRVSKNKTLFEKGYTPNWSTEIFRIEKIKLTNPVTYTLKDERNQPILGSFYEQELSKTKFPDSYLVEKIIKRQGNKYYVKWLGFNNSYNTWINKNEIIS